MFRMYASNSHSYTHLILALGIVREPTIWVFITSKYPGTHDIGLPSKGCPWTMLGEIEMDKNTLPHGPPVGGEYVVML